ncbi:A-kinase-interacting protein 1 isoform X3 [Phyllopteryx taeniolatus]|uniref:A-kinase-interacting protein 1 isoform X3 n=1 Tax=Phyllopteryx taeniolatus TaxID=161469 RepID=UPI002AD2DFF9|nr:A-kinase-interacting protein 1 isoform X3 [Phyllopteryx taeniolatus]
MATLTELQNSLRQTARLGLEVLERASRRKVDWSEPPHTYTPVADEDGAVYNKVRKLWQSCRRPFPPSWSSWQKRTFIAKGSTTQWDALEVPTSRRNTRLASIDTSGRPGTRVRLDLGITPRVRVHQRTSTWKWLPDRTPSAPAGPDHSSKPRWSTSMLAIRSMKPVESRAVI